MDANGRDKFLNELCPRLQPIVAQVMDCTCGCEALDFFRNRTRAWLEAQDVAHYLHQPVDQVAAALNFLTELGVLNRRDILGARFFSITKNEEVLSGLDQFWAWRDDWVMQLEHVKGALRL